MVLTKGVLLLGLTTLAVYLPLANAQQSSWSEWGPWNGNCSESSQVTQARTRFCIPAADGSNAPCVGESTDMQPCSACPSEGSWGEWTSMDSCSLNCGRCGRKYRTRECVQAPGCPPVSCPGKSREIDSEAGPCDSGKICMFPFKACCPGFKRYFNQEYHNLTCINSQDPVFATS